MRLRHIPGAKELVAGHELVIEEKAAAAFRGRWQELFGSAGRPLCLEIGMGRGLFIVNSAQSEPEANFLGLEMREEMIMQALEKLPALPPNLRFLHFNASLLAEVFACGEISRIYLNFPDPWPKTRHAKRRLTSVEYLSCYRQLLSTRGEIHFKTDSRDLFEWSRPNFSAAGLIVVEMNIDLPAASSGVITEYETRYRSKGRPIFYLRAVK